ncbi:hypothetical protein M0804_015215 [Polistes exclamans]|nr:hypothetical protein M0804_015215 [Polistes exclamans]
MIDTGAEINLIKSNVLRKSTETDATETVQLTGISQDRHSTLGTAKVRIFGEDVKFHLVEEDFPIQSNDESICIPSKMSQICYCYVANIEAKEGYIPRLQLPPGVYAGEALVKNENGKAYFKVINTTSKPVSLVIQRLELFDYSLCTLPNSAPNNSDPLAEICDPDQSEYLHYVHTIFASTSANETSKGDLVHKIRCSQVMARQNLVGAKIRSKVYYDRKARGQNHIVGQSVYLLKQPTSKLGNQYTGPHQILEVLPKNNIKISYKNGTRIVHKDKVKICAK